MTTNNVKAHRGCTSGFSRLMYDKCEYNKRMNESTSPLGYMMYSGAFENCSKCVFDSNNFWRPFDGEIIDTESDLKNITRRASNCPKNKYSPFGNKKGPIVFPPEACPIVKCSIPQVKGVGYDLNMSLKCGE